MASVDPREVENLYELTPLQQGLLFHTVLAPGSGMYVVQLGWTLTGRLEVPTFRDAWQAVAAQCDVLRTSFHWERLEKPLQAVHRSVDIPIVELDWRDLPPATQRGRLEAFMGEDRATGFDLARAPLMRLALFRLGDDRWRIVWTQHHLLLDGWSIALVLSDVFAVYAALQEGREVPAARTSPYVDYVAWLQRQDLKAAEAYWRRTLQGFTAPTPLRLGRTAAAAPEAAVQELRLSASTTTALVGLGRAERLTLTSLLQGAWAVLLSRYSDAEEVVFGSTVTVRPADLPDVEHLVGLCINSLPMRVPVPPDAELLPWLREFQTKQAAARRYDFAPAEAVQAWSDVPHGTPLYDSLVVVENYPHDHALSTSLGDLRVDEVSAREQTNYALTLAAIPGNALSLQLLYDAGRFDAGTIRRMLGHLRTLLEGMITDPGKRLGELSMLPEEERRRVLVEWNATARPYPRQRTLPELFEGQVEAAPGAVAVVEGDIALTYAELNRRANQVAHHLRSVGVGPDVLVGVYLERSVDLIVALMGIVKAGGAYLPLDLSYPPDRLTFMLADSQTPVLVTQERLLSGLPSIAAHICCLDRDWPILASTSSENPPLLVRPEHLAYVIYTSGSTGRPKGVGVIQRGVVRLVCNSNYISLQPDDGVAQLSSPSFDAATFEIWGALLHGARLVLLRKEVALSPRELAAHLQQQRITTLFLTTALFNQLALSAPETFRSLRHLMFGGEAVDPRPVRQVLETAPPRRLLHFYGPTETTTFATWHPVKAVPADATTVPIGRPVANTTCYVLDRQLRPVPIGVPGELFIGGDGVARGYLGQPTLTAERFLPDQFSGEVGARLYRTGDQVRQQEDGALVFLGRLDGQVKVRGFRIELGEVEAALGQHPAIREVAVAARPDGSGDRHLVAYLVSAGTALPPVEELRRFLAQRLPTFMIPAAFVPLSALPLQPNGKVDRDALPTPDALRPELEAQFVAPRTPAERTLAEVWERVLGLERVGIDDNFFALGGDSILSLQVVSLAARAGLQLTSQRLFQHPTIAELAAVAGEEHGSTVEHAPLVGPVPLLPIQRWFFECALPDPHHFNLPLLLEARQPLDPVLLDRAIAALIVHHDALRLRFSEEDGCIRQAASPPQDTTGLLSRADLSRLPAVEQDRAMLAALERVETTLDLAAGPLLRAVYFDLGPRQPGRLALIVHHLVVDMVSWRILLEDLLEAYRQLEAGRALQLPPKTTSLRRWAEELEGYAQSQRALEELPFWLAQDPSQAPSLPVDYPEGENSEGAVASITVSLTTEETGALLQDVPRVYRAQVSEALLAALLHAFVRWTGASVLTMDLEGHGREDLVQGVDLSRTVGWFTSMFPVRLALGDARTPAETVRAVRDQLARISHHGLGYGLLRYLSHDQAVADQLRQAPAQVSVNYLGQLDQLQAATGPFRLLTEPWGHARSPRQPRAHLLDVVGMVVDGRFQLRWDYSQRVHLPSTIQSVADDTVEALRALLAATGAPEESDVTPADFPLAGLNQQQLARLLSKARKPR